MLYHRFGGNAANAWLVQKSERWLVVLPENGLHLKAELPRPFSYLAAFQIPLAHKAVRRQLFRCAFPLRCVTCAR